MSIVYNLIILAVCWVFYTVMTKSMRTAAGAPSMSRGCGHRWNPAGATSNSTEGG